ncbi:hypothetical protein R3P38DRAFT_2533481, partial [Favolaschia claudopus]
TAQSEVSPEPHSVWIQLDDTNDTKKAHKKSILRTLMDPNFDADHAKSHDRLLRIRCFSIGGDHFDRTASKIHDNFSNEHLLRLQDLFATLIAINSSQVSLAILQCTIIKSSASNPATYLDAAPTAEIGLANTPYSVTGQVLSLVPFLDAADSISWAWDTSFAGFESVKVKNVSTDSVSRKRHINICIDGRLVLPLVSSNLSPSCAILDDVAGPGTSINTAERVDTTWVFSDSKLTTIKEKLLSLVTDEAMRARIPVHGPVREGSSDNIHTICASHLLPSVAAPSHKDGRRKCRVCGKDVAGPDRQNHRSIFSVSDTYPCGFCGKSTTNEGCTISIRNSKASSSCVDVYEFQIAAALKSSISKPCTNAPVRCPLCPQIHWKYNMDAHLRDAHPNWELTATEATTALIASRTTITRDEESRLKIPVHSKAPHDAQVDGPSSREKRPATESPAGTPRRLRIRRTTRTDPQLEVPDSLMNSDSESDFAP